MRGALAVIGLGAAMATALPASAPGKGAAAQAADPTTTGRTVIDDFEGTLDWMAQPADGVKLELHRDAGREGRGMRMDFEFAGGGYAIARKKIALDLAENYELSFWMKGRSRPNTIEFKLVDDTGENVWWHVRRDIPIPAQWERMRSKKRHISFAWGPLGGGDIRRIAAIEIVVTASQGGKGSVWIDDLEMRTLPPDATGPIVPRASASSARPGHEARRVLDARDNTRWIARDEDASPWIELDLGAARPIGGLVLEWAPGRQATEYRVQAAEERNEWNTVRQVQGGNGGRDALFFGETDARFVRVTVTRAAHAKAAALESIELGPLSWATSREAFFAAQAKEAGRGIYPRSIAGEQMYWTVVGADADPHECLLSEDGMLELGKGRPSIEPFLFDDGRLITWANVRVSQELEEGVLPIPSVVWESETLRLRITACDAGAAGASAVVARYRVDNLSLRPRRAKLFLAVRPFQVNPPSQSLNLQGGTAPIRQIDFDGRDVELNGERAVICILPPDDFGASTFDGGEIVGDFLKGGRLPITASCTDSTEAASGAIAYELDLGARASKEFAVVVPLHARFKAPEFTSENEARAWVNRQFEDSRDAWRARTSSITFDLPEPAASWARAMQSQVGYILVNRAGPAIQPGTRSYARSWIRDGALTSSALLRVGHEGAARQFLEWYAPHQYEDGKIPCVVDARGADPVPEHDSGGEFIFLTAELYRFDGDRKLAQKMWPRVEKAAMYLDALRQQRKTPEFLVPQKREFYGILPPSISHEGYSAKPMHSYWDDFFALRGFHDAAWLAGELGKKKEQRRLEGIAAEFERDLGASIALAMEKHAIDFVPGCADLGDFDATSTTIALSPCEARHVPPPGALESTFDLYMEHFRARRDGKEWDAYTPYEFRNVGALLRLGRRDDALAAMEYFFDHRRPHGWNQWPEVIRRDARAPAFLGDLPHTWVGSDFMRSFMDLFLYEEGDALVIGAGIPQEWLDRREGIAVRGLRTKWGPLDVAMQRDRRDRVLTLSGDARIPAEGILVKVAGLDATSRVLVNARPVQENGKGEILLKELPVSVRILP